MSAEFFQRSMSGMWVVKRGREVYEWAFLQPPALYTSPLKHPCLLCFACFALLCLRACFLSSFLSPLSQPKKKRLRSSESILSLSQRAFLHSYRQSQPLLRAMQAAPHSRIDGPTHTLETYLLFAFCSFFLPHSFSPMDCACTLS